MLGIRGFHLGDCDSPVCTNMKLLRKPFVILVRAGQVSLV